MITRETLIQTATTHQTTELNVAREYCQHLFLRAFYQQKGSEQVTFKGGTALKIVYDSPRFSEDLDFSGFGVTVAQIEDWLLTSVNEIELNGIGVDIVESKSTSGGYLSNLHCHLRDYGVHIQVEISLRQQNDVHGIGTIFTQGIPTHHPKLPDNLAQRVGAAWVMRSEGNELAGAPASTGSVQVWRGCFWKTRIFQ
ncbi:MAG: nucleotidyl transferase AbiEii/AbiGii toxin family protein [Anaerolineales bacterium]